MGVASPSSPSPGIDFRSAALNLARLSERADSTPERWGWRMKNRQTFTGEIKIPPLSPSPSLNLHAHPWSSPPSPLDLWKWDMAVGGRLGQQSTLLLLLHPLDPPTHWQAVPFFLAPSNHFLIGPLFSPHPLSPPPPLRLRTAAVVM